MTPETNTDDALTENGILTDYPDVTMEDYRYLHGDPKVENDDVVIFGDSHGHELNEWADVLDMSRSDLSARMHEAAREYHSYGDVRGGAGDPWAVLDPVVFDARTFDERESNR